jgi:4-amino-4-deoxy-L-arabinose transferase-like glycosyltransferase
LWDIDEGMHAATTKDMVLSGDWVTPQYNGKSFFDKPPLYNWVAAIFILTFGMTEFAVRLPAALFGSGCVMVTYLLARKMFGPLVGFLSGIILATSIEFIILSRVVVHDICLAFFVTLALLFFYQGFEDERHRKTNFICFYVALGFAVLSKGPPGLVLPVMVVGLFLMFKRKLAFLKEMQIGWGLLIFLIVASPWYILISMQNPDYAGYFFIKKNIGSFVSDDVQHLEAFYYYAPVLLGGFFPWSCFLPLTLVRTLRFPPKDQKEPVVFLLIWGGFIFIFFSLASSKLATYILPLFPAVSILTGVLWYDLLKSSAPHIRRGFLFSFFPLVVIFPLALVYILIYPPTQLTYDSGIDLTHLYYIAVGTVVWIVGSFSLLLMKKDYLFFASIAGMVIALLLICIILIVPSINPYRSTKRLALKLDRMLPEKEDLIFFKRERDSALFYTNRRALVLRTPQQLKEYLASNKKIYCILKRDHLKELADLKQFFDIIDREGEKLLITNKKLRFSPDGFRSGSGFIL